MTNKNMEVKMSRSKINYKVYSGKNFKNIFKDSKILILTLIFSAGIITGAVILNYESEIIKNLSDYINYNISVKSGQGISDIFFNSLFSNCIFLFLNIFLAFSLIGYPLIIWIPFLKGLGLGAVFGYLYSLYGLSGFGYSVLTIFPGATVSTFALVTACNISCDYSKNAYSKAIIGKGQFEKGETKYYLIKQFVYISICIVSSLIDTLFSMIFLRFFEL